MGDHTIAGSRLPAFADSRNLRLFLGTLLYLAQGFPQGVVFYAIPSWLAVNGQSAAIVGSAAAAASLPWALKWAVGGLMDRYTYMPMGRRRPWLVGAQLCILAMFFAYALVSPLPDQTNLVIGFTFALSALTAIQDVALDALVIDITPASEMGRLNGFMFGGKLFGIATGTAVTGYFMQYYGISSAMLVMMLCFSIPALASIAIRERPGERLLPWTNGATSEASQAIKSEAWWPILRIALANLMRRNTVLVIAMLIGYGVYQGLYEQGASLFAARALGWGESAIGGLIGASNIILGSLSLLVGGFVIDRFGPRATTLVAGFGGLVIWGSFAFVAADWINDMVFLAFAIVGSICGMLFYLSFLVIAMRVSVKEAAATSFALIIATQAAGASLGGVLLGPTFEWGGFTAIFFAAGVIVFVASLTTLGMSDKAAGALSETDEEKGA